MTEKPASEADVPTSELIRFFQGLGLSPILLHLELGGDDSDEFTVDTSPYTLLSKARRGFEIKRSPKQ